LSLPVGALKLPLVTALSYSCTRSKDWDDILTAHMDEVIARTWTMQSKRLGKHSLKLQEDTKSKKSVGSVKVMFLIGRNKLSLNFISF
jgi:U3 small nucleolar RNA-associated protein 21